MSWFQVDTSRLSTCVDPWGFGHPQGDHRFDNHPHDRFANYLETLGMSGVWLHVPGLVHEQPEAWYPE